MPKYCINFTHQLIFYFKLTILQLTTNSLVNSLTRHIVINVIIITQKESFNPQKLALKRSDELKTLSSEKNVLKRHIKFTNETVP